MSTHNFSKCAPEHPIFPVDWKEALFRQLGGPKEGYICPICKRRFSGPEGFKQLEGDHIIPRAKGGKTTWDNFQLLCISCNRRKSKNLIQTE
ncbi:HNH endonuclease [Desulfohalobium retbaense]|uniref:HNH endonuclease n=1 Tax=Desulfohalobium retbaense TaxID=45663 RepID=UPI00019B49E2|nr:HNH endonuclease signature motif containing protein [Desulfohalobium retbaense]